LQQGGVGEFVFLEKGVEAAQVTVVGHFDAGHVVGIAPVSSAT
jgi:riboflavin synthase alpha subunit